MQTVVPGHRATGYRIPERADAHHRKRFEVSVQLSDRRTRCAEIKDAPGWQERIRAFVQRVADELAREPKKYTTQIRRVRISRVHGQECLSERCINDLTTIRQ